MNYILEDVKIQQNSVPKQEIRAVFETEAFIANTRIKVFSVFRIMNMSKMTSKYTS